MAGFQQLISRAGAVFRILLTIALVGAAIWWLTEVASTITTAPTVDARGNVLDPYARSKDILLAVLPLLTTALGYWFGAQGKEQEQQKARVAQEKSEEKDKKLQVVLAKSDDTQLLQKAQEAEPELFAR
ncbi:MAG: hypothetical protein QOE59_4228 [Actinomycetota bacterium]|jgi:hypothetical protein|nr:hypothetical protein [Actinomycetota bacterium]